MPLKKPNKPNLPDASKEGVESLTGCSMDAVKVHFNSVKPEQLKSHAYAQGTDIHLVPEQEHHMPHETWHVVQQAQSHVAPTQQMHDTPVNDDMGLEKEADKMGAKASKSFQKKANPKS